MSISNPLCAKTLVKARAAYSAIFDTIIALGCYGNIGAGPMLPSQTISVSVVTGVAYGHSNALCVKEMLSFSFVLLVYLLVP